jgi:CPA2 family monovalent cation:H+ antiporter-2
VPEAVILAGAMGVSSSAITTKLLIELRRLTNAETPVILGIIVIEDLFLALYLAAISPLLSGSESTLALLADIGTSFGFLLFLFVLARFGARLVAGLIGSEEDDLLAVLMFGLVVLVAGASEELGVSDAIGALLIGLVVSRTTLRDRVERIVVPMRDVFAAVFFVVFGLTVDVRDLGAVVVPVAIAIAATGLMNTIAGVVTARLFGFNQRSAANVGTTLLARGEFSLILVSLAIAAGLDQRLAPFVALYVLVLAVISPVLAARSRYLAPLLPLRLMRPGWRFVGRETITTACTHLDQIQVTDTESRECAPCVELGDEWVELRMCMICGAVGCCDDSKNKHATAHFGATQHPIVRSLEPGGDWRYCYVDGTLVQEPLGRASSEA